MDEKGNDEYLTKGQGAGTGSEISPRNVTVKTESCTIIRHFSLNVHSYWTSDITYYVTESHPSFSSVLKDPDLPKSYVNEYKTREYLRRICRYIYNCKSSSARLLKKILVLMPGKP